VIKGPQGKSLFNDLDPKSLEGLFVAFSAGTGVFVFIDIVLRIFLQNYSQVFARQANERNNGRLYKEDVAEKYEEYNWFPETFVFHLYLSYTEGE